MNTISKKLVGCAIFGLILFIVINILLIGVIIDYPHSLFYKYLPNYFNRNFSFSNGLLFSCAIALIIHADIFRIIFNLLGFYVLLKHFLILFLVLLMPVFVCVPISNIVNDSYIIITFIVYITMILIVIYQYLETDQKKPQTTVFYAINSVLYFFEIFIISSVFIFHVIYFEVTDPYRYDRVELPLYECSL